MDAASARLKRLPQTLWAHNAQLVSGFLQHDEMTPMLEKAAPYSEINAMF
jgi:hypothetical protein